MMHLCTLLILLVASLPVALHSARDYAYRVTTPAVAGPGLPEVDRLEVEVPPPTRRVTATPPNFLRQITPVLDD